MFTFSLTLNTDRLRLGTVLQPPHYPWQFPLGRPIDFFIHLAFILSYVSMHADQVGQKLMVLRLQKLEVAGSDTAIYVDCNRSTAIEWT